MIFMATMMAFTVMDIIGGYTYPLPFNVAAILLASVAFFLNRKGYFLTARFLLALIVNVITLYFTAVLDRDMGLFMFAICINVGTLAAFGFENVKTALAMVGVSTLGFLFAMFHNFQRLDPADLANPHFTERNLLFGFLIAGTASVMVVYYLLQSNHHFETSLIRKEAFIDERNRELVLVNNELDKFFYSASHDLRAPLTSMQGLLDLMDQSNDPAEHKEYTKLLRGRVENLEQFVRTITAYSANAKAEVQCQQVVLRSIIREALEHVRFYPNASSIDIQLDIPHTLEIVSDPTRLQIIFGNLLANAIKYHDFTKAKPFIAIRQEAEPGAMRITIEDNGSGIPEDVLPRIFDMFYRGHRSSQGSGLGLYIVREALDKLKGKIDVESTYGQGTKFTVTLPSTIANN